MMPDSHSGYDCAREWEEMHGGDDEPEPCICKYCGDDDYIVEGIENVCPTCKEICPFCDDWMANEPEVEVDGKRMHKFCREMQLEEEKEERANNSQFGVGA